MKLVVDNLDNDTGWVLNPPSTIETRSEKEYVAGLNDNSLMIYFDEADTIKTAIKTFASPLDVTQFSTLIFSVWSSGLGRDLSYLSPSEFSYKITLDGIHEYYFPIYRAFTDIEIGLEDVDEINQIQITALHNVSDYIIISEMIAEAPDYPYDVLFAIKESIDYFMEKAMGLGLLIGQVIAPAGAPSITIDHPPHLDRYGVVRLNNGSAIETHQVEDNDGETFQLNDNFDGDRLVNNNINSDCYLAFTSYINPGQFEIRLPGISIWGIAPSPLLRGGKITPVYDTFEVGGGCKVRTEPQILSLSVQLHCEGRSHEMIDIMTKVVRHFISGESLWVNGRRCDIAFDGDPEEFAPGSGIDYIPKISYGLTVETKEFITKREAVALAGTVNLEIDSIF